MKCVHCDSEVKVKNLTHRLIYYCDNCFQTYDYSETNICCENPILELVKSNMCDGRIILFKQCQNCGFKQTKAIPYKNNTEINLFDVKLLNVEKSIERINVINKEIQDFKIQFDSNNSNKKLNLFSDSFNKYYSTKQWENKRKMVLKRDNNICQSCLSKPATQVHHLTYKHFRHEPLFDLISVCNTCHEVITKIDRKELSVND